MSDKNQKHCLVVTCFSEGQPGFLDFSYRIKSLAEHYQLTVVSSFPITQSELQLPNVSYVVIHTGDGRLGWLSYLWRCTSLIRQQRPDVAVLLHSMAAPVALLVGRIPTITYWNEHPTHVAPDPTGASPIKAITRALVRWLMFQGARKSSLVMPIGEAHRDDLLAHGCKRDRVQMIYMGVEQSFAEVSLSALIRNEDAPLQLVYVGSVHKDRGRDVMLEAMAIANQSGKIAHLTIVGATAEQSTYCHEALQKLEITHSVTIHGRVPGQMIPDYLKAADAGLCLWEDLPWYRFNPPTKLFEYLVAGLPVLASNIRTHTEYVLDGFNGVIFEYNSLSLGNAIQRLWQARDELPLIKRRTSGASVAYLWRKIEPEFLQAVKSVAC
ncbi:glycosyltransferase [Methylotenera sp.]|uniref:glycosyltransferase n=1 Tax=Methylotenera sp. TaxID=2051956 RepID=UPI00271DD40B|nr:glycosyltransferase [Methylotenera sp.]MDO9204591.1 glycosyltransferase [Methylotenera sp.]MDP2071279.1 glycosyltransferase [Methylotenera sp.]MDP3005196.1 glycosyltransferase [Methylotenera sp.]